MQQLSTHTASRYLQPLREGGSLPAIVDTDGGGRFVVKFRGAGQGARVLVAELIVGLLADALGFPVPELAIIQVPPQFGRSEPDPEIQELLQRSHGINVGLRYLDGAFNFDAHAAGELIGDRLASDLVWFDALVTNPDRTHRNPNLMVWERRPWLIDHGAALYAHYDWKTVDAARTKTAFPLTKQHVLLRRAVDLEGADERLSAALTDEVIAAVLARVPDALLLDPVSGGGEFATGDEARERYARYFRTRLEAPRAFAAEAIRARDTAASEPPRRVSARR
ncbi:MAG TPA: HipA family kinase [Longimicrobium sp.]|nr:HipA family kinase [Longimicrobium sp.]